MSTRNNLASVGVVLDTQALLDWQFFRDPCCADWGLPGEGSGWRWLATASMRDELAHVLARGIKGQWPSRAEHVLAFFDEHAMLCANKSLPVPALQRLRCTDPDDQKFIDLALSCNAAWLVSRDRAVLKLQRRAFALGGLRIVRPQDWRPPE